MNRAPSRMWIEDMMNNYEDVWIVPVKAGIEYMRNPVPKDELEFFEPFGCFELPVYTCINTRDCRWVYLHDDWRSWLHAGFYLRLAGQSEDMSVRSSVRPVQFQKKGSPNLRDFPNFCK